MKKICIHENRVNGLQCAQPRGGLSCPRLRAPAFVLGIYLLSLSPLQKALAAPQEKQQRTANQAGDQTRIKLKVVRTSDGELEEGEHYFISFFQAPDGTDAKKGVAVCKSPLRANEELERSTKSALRVLRTRPELDANGKTVGKRVLAVYAPAKGSGQSIIKLSWTIGKKFLEIESQSMANVLELEKESDESASKEPDVQ